MGARIGSLVINCHDLDRMKEFWSAVTGYEQGPTFDEGYFVVLGDPSRRVNLSLQKVRGGEIGRNQMHIDFHVPDEEAEADRAVALGAVRVRKCDDPDDTYVVLADPEGNEFCMCRVIPSESTET